MTHDAHRGFATDGLPPHFEYSEYSDVVAKIRRQVEERVASDLDRVRAEIAASFEEQRQQARERLRQQAVSQAQPQIGQALSEDVGRRLRDAFFGPTEQALFRVIAEQVLKLFEPVKSPPPSVTGELQAVLPPLQLSASGTATTSGSIEMELVPAATELVRQWPGTWSRKTTRLVLQFQVATVTAVVVGCFVDANSELADDVTLWTGGSVWAVAWGTWKLIGWAFDKLYPPQDGE